MQTRITQQHDSVLGRMPGISLALPCVAAILLTWGPSSVGSAGDSPAPAVAPAILTPAYSANDGLSAGDQSQEGADVATFVEWHVQARHLTQYDHQTVLTAMPRPERKEDGRPTAVSVAAPLWTTYAR